MTKRINAQNWLQADDNMTSFKVMSAEGTAPIDQQGWIRLITEPQLQVSVPGEVRRLFDAARGSVAYGYFYYALCMMGSVALFRTAEAALAYKRRELDNATPGSPGASFDQNLSWLADRGLVQIDNWIPIAAARNYVVHPTPQEIVARLQTVAEQINVLFPMPSKPEGRNTGPVGERN